MSCAPAAFAVSVPPPVHPAKSPELAVSTAQLAVALNGCPKEFVGEADEAAEFPGEQTRPFVSSSTSVPPRSCSTAVVVPV